VVEYPPRPSLAEDGAVDRDDLATLLNNWGVGGK
jgi:hypothetical protein